MSEAKSTATETKKLPPLDQVPDATMPVLVRKETRLDEDKPEETPSVPPWLNVEGGDPEICGMPPHEVFNSLELCNRGCKEFNRQADTLNARMEQIRVALKRVATISHLLSKHQQRLQSMNPKNPASGIKEFQKRSTEKKMEQLANVQQFMKGGTTAKDLQKALTIGSPLDNAHKRKGGFGQKRPAAVLLKKATV